MDKKSVAIRRAEFLQCTTPELEKRFWVLHAQRHWAETNVITTATENADTCHLPRLEDDSDESLIVDILMARTEAYLATEKRRITSRDLCGND